MRAGLIGAFFLNLEDFSKINALRGAGRCILGRIFFPLTKEDYGGSENDAGTTGSTFGGPL
jgi:hypothetical protein